MNNLKFQAQHSLVSAKQITKTSALLVDEVNAMQNARRLFYEDLRASLNLPFDQNLLNNVQHLVKEKQRLKPTLLLVIGIGGSNLGTQAVQEAIQGKLYNQNHPKLKVFYIDTIDTLSLMHSIEVIKKEYQNKGRVLLNVISKSGTTIETVTNYAVLLKELKKHETHYQDLIVLTTDRDSKLWNYGLKNNISLLEIPPQVGGRFSVLTSVGLFPLGLMGINITELLQGAASMVKEGLKINNVITKSAAISYLHYKKGRNISNLFLFNPNLAALGKWYQQLLAESIGKKSEVGITPIVSIGTTDLHSILQLCLGGPDDKMTTFVSIENYKRNIKVPHLEQTLTSMVKNKAISGIISSILSGVQLSYRKYKRPYTEILLPNISEFSIGQFLQFKMLETMYLGALCKVNPFDQPHVEDYKKAARNALGK